MLATIGGVTAGPPPLYRTTESLRLDRELRKSTPPLIGVDLGIGAVLLWRRGLWVDADPLAARACSSSLSGSALRSRGWCWSQRPRA